MADDNELPDRDELERQLDRAIEGIRRKAKVWEDAELSRMESTLSDTTPPAFYKDVPPPGFCHPYHERAKRVIIDWLDGKSGLNAYDLRLPVPARVKFELHEPEAFAAAPYVGRPFVYWWWAGVDDHGRGVGGEKTTLAYTDSGWGYDDRD